MSTRPALLYGSCVSRDAFELVKDERPLAGYVARQSLISAMGDPLPPPDLSELDSPFQRRMVTEDHQGSLLSIVSASAGEIGLLMVDLVDERLGVCRVTPNGYATHSNEFVRAGLHMSPAYADWIKFGTALHLDLYRSAVERFAAVLDEAGLRSRTLVIDPPFAAKMDDGTPCPVHAGREAAEWNRLYRPYFDAWRTVGIEVYAVPPERALGTYGHRWGAGPYHYAETTYRAILEEVARRGL